MRVSKIFGICVLITLFGVLLTSSLSTHGQISYKDGYSNLEKDITKSLTNSFVGRIRQNIHFYLVISIDKKGRVGDIYTVGVNDTSVLNELISLVKKTDKKWDNQSGEKITIGIPIFLEYDNSDNVTCKVDSQQFSVLIQKPRKSERVFNLPTIKLIFYPTVK